MRPERNTALLQTAFVWAERSTCSRLHVGAVFARDGRILVQGYNGAPAGMPHCNHECDCRLFQRNHTSMGFVHAESCRSLQPCTTAVHAEQNAIAYAARWGVGLESSILYCTDQPCLTCAMSLVNLGLQAVIFVREYRLPDGVRLLEEAGVKVLKHSDPRDRISE